MTELLCVVKRNLYRDSMRLLQITEEVKKIKGVIDASVVMGTPTNKELLAIAGLLREEAKAASETDMIISILVEDYAKSQDIMSRVDELIAGQAPSNRLQTFNSVQSALDASPDARFALVSIPGEYAITVVKQLLDRGLHVQLFSDHVPVKDEVELKKYAIQKGLFLLGPGSGTSIIGGIGLGFANAVKKGDIGIVSAAGTGLQEVSSLLSNINLGISQGLGVGGGDLKDDVGGMMSLAAIGALEEDPDTSLLCVISKPPGTETLPKIENYIKNSTKKTYVVCLLGGDIKGSSERIRYVRSLHSAVATCARLKGEEAYDNFIKKIQIGQERLISLVESEYSKLNVHQKYIRGLYTGGTLCYESQIILSNLVNNVFSNSPVDDRFRLKDPYKSVGNSIVDLGEEEFTSGRAHPMIDPTIRRLRLLQEARDPRVACVALDFVLGYGANEDPAGSMMEAIRSAKEIASKDGRYLSILAHVCGTDNDPQSKELQEKMLRDEGVLLFNTNAQMAVASAIISSRAQLSKDRLKETLEFYLEAA